MLRIERYLFRTAGTAFLVVLSILTAVIWVTQALRQLDLMTDKGQTILVFLTITGLGIPFLCAVIAPVALFNAMLYSLNKLNSDSELIVMSAAGVSPWQLLRPFVALFVLVFLALAGLYIEVMPRCFDAINALTGRIHADFIANFARPGVFNELESGFVFHFRERGDDGSLRGVFIQDRRDPQQISTYIADKGAIVDQDGKSYLLLLKGSTQRPRGSGDSSLVTFDEYAIDLSQFVHPGETWRGRRSAAPGRCCSISSGSPVHGGTGPGRTLQPLHQPVLRLHRGNDRLRGARRSAHHAARPRLGDRRLRVVFALIRLLGLAIGILMRGKPGGLCRSGFRSPPGPPAGVRDRRRRLHFRRADFAGGRAGAGRLRAMEIAAGAAPMMPGVLTRYFAKGFFFTVVSVFAGVFNLIFTVNFVETLRRSADHPNVNPAITAWLALLQTPIVAGQALPFAVLLGSMIAFLNFSRRLELVVARAAGVSVWQFLAPALTVAVADRPFRDRRLQSSLDAR